MARTVGDAMILLDAISGRDPDDAAADAKADAPVASRTALDAAALAGVRIGIVRNRLFGYNAAADRLAESAIAEMRRQGAAIVDPADIPTLGKFDDSEFDVLLYEFKADMQKYLQWLGPRAPAHSLADLIAFNRGHAKEELPYFGQEIMEQAEGKKGLGSPEYAKALAKNHRLARAEGIDAVIKKYRLDALVAPTGGPAWLTDLVNGDGGTATAPGPSTVAAVAGYPHITVPMGFYHGLPLGLSFFGSAWSEPTLIRIAYAFEQATKHRKPPTFPPTADLK
jgi:amidase